MTDQKSAALIETRHSETPVSSISLKVITVELNMTNVRALIAGAGTAWPLKPVPRRFRIIAQDYVTRLKSNPTPIGKELK